MDRPLVIITGIDGGLGSALRSLLSDDFAVVGMARKAGKDACVRRCDLSSQQEIEEAYSDIIQSYGAPSFLVNCAGVYHAKGWDVITVDEFDSSYSVNIRAPFLLSRLFARSFPSDGRKGAIVNVASISGQIGSIDPAYASSKAGLIMLTRTLARSFAEDNLAIRVNAVAPGPIEGTAMGDRIPHERMKSYREKIPMKRFATTNEVANAVKFLLGDEASYITGAVLNVDGGLV
ncbi:MAG: SDR family oxidoreductase [Alphaproteobacteria bacterium]|nr:SDR family oxidoreductase [Alphaproteobacteria bacterium]